MEQKPLSGVLAGALVFGSSGAVLVVEIIAARLLAPYVGLDIETYTTIIGVVLAGISVGAWLGGRAADLVDPRLLLGPMLVLGGLTTAGAVPLVQLLGEAGDGSGLALAAITVAAFFLPAALLSTITPLVIKLQLRALEETGGIVGRFSALGTVGALLGTFLTGFVLIPLASTSDLMVGLGALLAVCGSLLLFGAGVRMAPLLAIPLAAGAVAISLAGGPRCDVESVYSCARIVLDPERAGGRTLYLDDVRNSYVALDDPTHLEWEYLRRFVDLVDQRWPEGEPLRALHIGGAGFTFPRYLEAVRPGSRSTVLEIDPELVKLAESELGLRRDEDLEVRIGDGRRSIGELEGERFDLIVGDAFSGRSVPWQLTTTEAVDPIRERLERDGLYLMNLIDGEPWDLTRAEVATLRQSFEHVGAYLPGDDTYGNVALVASPEPLAVATVPGARYLAGAELERFTGDIDPLRDDFAPVEQLRGRP
ncbi:MAG: fused MFS/spermidine synthase [Solirubrobacterales bacterium]